MILDLTIVNPKSPHLVLVDRDRVLTVFILIIPLLLQQPHINGHWHHHHHIKTQTAAAAAAASTVRARAALLSYTDIIIMMSLGTLFRGSTASVTRALVELQSTVSPVAPFSVVLPPLQQQNFHSFG